MQSAHEKKIKTIQMISARFPPQTCGIGDYTFHLSKALRGLAFNVENLHGFNRPFTALKLCPLFLSSAAKESILHLQYEPFNYSQSYLLPWIVRKWQGPLIVTAHEVFHRSEREKSRDRHLYQSADRIIVNDPIHVEKLAALGVEKSKIEVLWVGSNIPVISANAIEKSKSEFRLGYFGFVNAVKNVEAILKAISLLKSESSLSFRLIGDIRKAQKQELLRLAGQLGIENKVSFTQRISAEQASSEIQLCDLMILPFTDGASLRRGSLMAALAHGKAIITSARNPADTRLQKSDAVKLLSDLTAESLSQEILSLMKSETERKKLQSAALTFSERHSWQELAKAHIPIYQAATAIGASV